MAVVAFGPDESWFVESPSQWKWGTLPERCLNFFRSTQPSGVAHVHNLILGANGSFLMTWRGKDGSNYQFHAGLPAHLAAWLDKKDHKGRLVHNIAGIRLALGPNNASYFVTDGKAYQWLNLPPGLKSALDGLSKPGGGFTYAPRIVALGARGNYMMITAGNGGSWSVAAYPELDTFLDEKKAQHGSLAGLFSNVATVTLDACDGRNFVLTCFNGDYFGYVPDELDNAVWPVLDTLPKSVGRQQARASKMSTLNSALKLANTVLRVESKMVAASGGGGGGGGGVDFSGANDAFTASLQNQTWSSVDNAANWNVQ
ncbi:hypothetical protein SBRCBS47491_004953 [Sporothrix bragantina]|uniref:Uncharacterized protein n=1 Tax=Sporothrix bragantina TaxID=671064 RepID=A0ABP0BSX2_9PEZI